MPNRKRTLEIDEDIAFQRKEWVSQRVGVAVLFLTVIGALLGAGGMGGPLSHAEAADSEGAVRLEYERIVRRGATATMRLHLRAEPGDVRFWVASPYFENVIVETVAPAPVLVSVERARHVYTIRAGASPVTVTLHVDHTTIGRIEGEVGLVGGPSTRFTQWSLF